MDARASGAAGRYCQVGLDSVTILLQLSKHASNIYKKNYGTRCEVRRHAFGDGH